VKKTTPTPTIGMQFVATCMVPLVAVSSDHCPSSPLTLARWFTMFSAHEKTLLFQTSRNTTRATNKHKTMLLCSQLVAMQMQRSTLHRRI
jgi:hypothetical protein